MYTGNWEYVYLYTGKRGYVCMHIEKTPISLTWQQTTPLGMASHWVLTPGRWLRDGRQGRAKLSSNGARNRVIADASLVSLICVCVVYMRDQHSCRLILYLST